MRPGRLLAVLLVLAGVAGVLIDAARSDGAAATVPARGPFWKLFVGDGEVKQIEPPSEGVEIRPGESFRLDDVYNAAATLESLMLRVRNPGRQSGYVRVHFRNESTRMYRLMVVPGEDAVLGTLAYVSEGRPPERLAEGRLPGLLAAPGDPFEITLHLDGPAFVVEVDGKELLRARDDRISTGHVVVWADDVRLLRAGISGLMRYADGESRSFWISDDMRAFERGAARRSGQLLTTAAWVLAVLLAVAAFLANLCLRAPPAGLLWRATFAALAPVGALFALRPLLAMPHETLLAVAAGSLGLLFALFVLRDHTRALAPTGARGVARSVVVVLALGGLTGWTVGSARAVALRPVIGAEQRSLSDLSEQPYDLAAPTVLDASNALDIPGPYRSLELGAELTLDPDSLLELRLRAEPGLPNGVALFLSSDARWPCRFFLETKSAFRPLGDGFGVLEAGRAYTLSLRALGDEYEVSLDGRTVARTDARAFPSGSLVALAARGRVRLARLDLRPITPEPPIRGAASEAWTAASAPLALLLLAALAAVVLLRVPWLAALEGTSWMLVPIALALHGWGAPGGRLALAPFLVTVVAIPAFLLPWALLHRHLAGALRTAAFLALAALLGGAALERCVEMPALSFDRAGVPQWTEFDLPRIDAGLGYLQHPFIRRFNSYIVDHTFRGRTFSAEPEPGVVRVVSMGSSSTWGHGIDVSSGLDYPTVLEGLLAARLPGRRIEVINGAVRGSTVARLARVFGGSLLAFRPDIVTLSVYYNDSGYATRVDEDDYLTRITRPGYEHTLFERLRELLDSERYHRVTTHVWKRMDERHRDCLGAWNEVVTDPDVRTPPERFEAGIRAFAELGREHGFQLVLIKEPIKDNSPRIWRDEFRAVMDRLGEEYGLPVVDPAEALAAAGGARLFMDEVHPLPAGHRVVAEVLAPVVERLIRERTGDSGR